MKAEKDLAEHTHTKHMFRGCENRDGELTAYCVVCVALFSRTGPDDEDHEILEEMIGTMHVQLDDGDHLWTFSKPFLDYFQFHWKIKTSIENVFVIITFSVNIVEQMVAPYWVSDWENPSHENTKEDILRKCFVCVRESLALRVIADPTSHESESWACFTGLSQSSSPVWRLSTEAFQEYLEAQRAELQHRAGEATLTPNPVEPIAGCRGQEGPLGGGWGGVELHSRFLPLTIPQKRAWKQRAAPLYNEDRMFQEAVVIAV
ncbi:hypothetical protein IRJ41_007727 [Triplophysa rosa]|uniref:Uncharacterized protein n=1 Tax=Triplophysa rosa TaxID=992332 RepID=A0A9W7TAW4_TRIRA|nr:hypothetical protein IRJ41_007727 [Triplophysa rosa]